MLTLQLWGFVEVVITGVLVVTLIHAASLFQHMLSAWMTQQIVLSVDEEKTPAPVSVASQRITRGAPPPARSVTGILRLAAAEARDAKTNAGGRR